MQYTKLMIDMQVVAWQTDMTRVASFMLGRDGSNRAYREIGISDGHHSISHHQSDPEKVDKLIKIDELHVAMFAYLLEKLKETPDGDGTLLDHSLVLFGSSISESNIHTHDDLPIVLAGGANGRLKGNRHLVYPKETPLNNLFLNMFDLAGVPHVDGFGDSTGPADEPVGQERDLGHSSAGSRSSSSWSLVSTRRRLHACVRLFLIGLCCLSAWAPLAPLHAQPRDVRLLDAVKRRDEKAFAALLNAKADVNAAQPDGATALAWAVHLGERAHGGGAARRRRQRQHRRRIRRDAGHAGGGQRRRRRSSNGCSPPAATPAPRAGTARRPLMIAAGAGSLDTVRAAGAPRRRRERRGTARRSDRADVGGRRRARRRRRRPGRDGRERQRRVEGRLHAARLRDDQGRRRRRSRRC